MEARHEKRQRVLGQLIGNLFEPAKRLVESDGEFRAGSVTVSRQQVSSLRRYGYLDGLEVTGKAFLWYQDSLGGEEQ